MFRALKSLQNLNIVVFSSVFVMLAGLARIFILSKQIPAGEFAIYYKSTAVFSYLLLVVDSGVGASLLSNKEFNKSVAELYHNISMKMGMYILVLLLIGIAATSFCVQILQYALYISSLTLLLIIVAFTNVSRYYHQWAENYKSLAKYEMTGASLGVIVSISLVSIEMYKLSLVSTLILQTLYVRYRCHRTMPFKLTNSLRRALNADMKPARTGTNHSLGLFFGSAYKEGDVLLLSLAFNNETIGAYSLFKQLLIKPLVFLRIVCNRMMPNIVRQTYGKPNFSIRMGKLHGAVAVILVTYLVTFLQFSSDIIEFVLDPSLLKYRPLFQHVVIFFFVTGITALFIGAIGIGSGATYITATYHFLILIAFVASLYLYPEHFWSLITWSLVAVAFFVNLWFYRISRHVYFLIVNMIFLLCIPFG